MGETSGLAGAGLPRKAGATQAEWASPGRASKGQRGRQWRAREAMSVAGHSGQAANLQQSLERGLESPYGSRMWPSAMRIVSEAFEAPE